ncbi:hypothetical protein [Streptomyces sp. NPDC101455]|uniref:hypothetical protein n=1 Tax=Streptomyces sp. NPDC101455 TaxID=3366142 RepID=UPI00381E30A6
MMDALTARDRLLRGIREDHWVLIETLALAVPFHMIELANQSPEQLVAIASTSVSVIGPKGDALQFGGQKGAAAEAFNALARGLAAVALTAWGGVTFAGEHWCSVLGCPGADADHPQPQPSGQTVPGPPDVTASQVPRASAPQKRQK